MIASTYPSQPDGTALYGNLTLSVDLSFYRNQILDVMAMPEPSGGEWPGAVVVALLARRRRVGKRGVDQAGCERRLPRFPPYRVSSTRR